MHNKYKLLIFDWDGTLIDSEATIVSCMKSAISDLQLEYRSTQEIRDIIGLGLEEAIQLLFPGIDEVMLTDMVDTYRSHFFSEDAPKSELFSGVLEALDSLDDSGFMLAIATGKSRRGLDKDLASTGLENMFPITRTAEETFSKPNPMMLDEITIDYNVEVSEALMIGDSEYDLQMANNLGMDSLAVACGVHDQQRLLEQNPIGLVDHVADIPNWLSSEQIDDY